MLPSVSVAVWTRCFTPLLQTTGGSWAGLGVSSSLLKQSKEHHQQAKNTSVSKRVGYGVVYGACRKRVHTGKRQQRHAARMHRMF